MFPSDELYPASPLAGSDDGRPLAGVCQQGRYDDSVQTDEPTITQGSTRGSRAARRDELTSRFFQVLADPTRIRIVELLLTGERNVSELVSLLGLKQGRVSSHLACLRWCGFITTRREGKYVYYSITDPRVRQLVQLARQLLADHAGDVASCLRLAPEHAW